MKKSVAIICVFIILGMYYAYIVGDTNLLIFLGVLTLAVKE